MVMLLNQENVLLMLKHSDQLQIVFVLNGKIGFVLNVLIGLILETMLSVKKFQRIVPLGTILMEVV
jgi:hypothetical protein